MKSKRDDATKHRTLVIYERVKGEMKIFQQDGDETRSINSTAVDANFSAA